MEDEVLMNKSRKVLTPVCLAWVGEVREGFLEEAPGLPTGAGAEVGGRHSQCKDPGARRSPSFLLAPPRSSLLPDRRPPRPRPSSPAGSSKDRKLRWESNPADEEKLLQRKKKRKTNTKTLTHINSIVSTPRSCLKNKNKIKIKPQLGGFLW